VTRVRKRTPKQPLCQSLALPAVTRPLSANSAESVSSIVGVTPTAIKSRYRLVCRGSRGGKFYCYDTRLRQRTSLNTTDRRAAVQIVNAKNQAEQQPALNLQLAEAYLAGTDNGITKRTWADALAALTAMKRPANRARWERAAKDKAYVPLLPLIITETPAELMLKVLQSGTVSTNIYLRRLHNFCVDMNWLPWPLVPKRQWPVVRFKEKRAITADEHRQIVERERNPERKVPPGKLV